MSVGLHKTCPLDFIKHIHYLYLMVDKMYQKLIELVRLGHELVVKQEPVNVAPHGVITTVLQKNV